MKMKIKCSLQPKHEDRERKWRERSRCRKMKNNRSKISDIFFAYLMLNVKLEFAKIIDKYQVNFQKLSSRCLNLLITAIMVLWHSQTRQ